MEKVVVASESLFRPVNGVRSTCSLVEIHNSGVLNRIGQITNMCSPLLKMSMLKVFFSGTRLGDSFAIQFSLIFIYTNALC